MPMLEGRLRSASNYKSDEPVSMTFELVNHGDQDVYVLKWYTPLEGLFSDCLDVTRDGERVPYDGPLPKRGTPSARNYVLVPAGGSVAVDFELSRSYEVSVPGNYDVALNTEVDDVLPASQAATAAEALKAGFGQNARQSLRDGRTQFTVLPGEGGNRLTEGQASRRASRAVKRGGRAARGAQKKAGPKEPDVTGGDADMQAMTRQAHFNGYDLCISAVETLANDERYEEWFGLHTGQRFQRVRDNFSRMRDRMESTTFTYILTGAGCPADWYAYTYKDETRIWMCELFWDAPATGTNSKAGTVVHEHSHATARTDDIKYGRNKCRQLAMDDPEQAARNGDNYEFFAEG